MRVRHARGYAPRTCPPATPFRGRDIKQILLLGSLLFVRNRNMNRHRRLCIVANNASDRPAQSSYPSPVLLPLPFPKDSNCFSLFTNKLFVVSRRHCLPAFKNSASYVFKYRQSSSYRLIHTQIPRASFDGGHAKSTTRPGKRARESMARLRACYFQIPCRLKQRFPVIFCKYYPCHFRVGAPCTADAPQPSSRPYVPP